MGNPVSQTMINSPGALQTSSGVFKSATGMSSFTEGQAAILLGGEGPTCDATTRGMLVFIKKFKGYFYCAKDGWHPVTDDTTTATVTRSADVMDSRATAFAVTASSGSQLATISETGMKVLGERVLTEPDLARVPFRAAFAGGAAGTLMMLVAWFLGGMVLRRARLRAWAARQPKDGAGPFRAAGGA